MFGTSSQSGDKVDTILGQMTHTLTASLPIADIVLKSILRELVSTKVSKKN